MNKAAIEIVEDEDGCEVLVNGRPIEVVDVTEDGSVVAECLLKEVGEVRVDEVPSLLALHMQDEKGFGTYLFHELTVDRDDTGHVGIEFRCHHPNKYWEGRWGLSLYLSMMAELAASAPNLTVTKCDVEDDWKLLVLRGTAPENRLADAIAARAQEIEALIARTDVALGGFAWRKEYETNEALFCAEVLGPLLRKMGFVDIQYTGGPGEFGRDFTFSEQTPFGFLRHYGMQVKDGNVSGGNNSQIDDIIGQLGDAFSMPYVVLNSKEERYISTFIVAISGRFTNNAKQKITSKITAGLTGAVYFLDQEKIRELAERYWSR